MDKLHLGGNSLEPIYNSSALEKLYMTNFFILKPSNDAFNDASPMKK